MYFLHQNRWTLKKCQLSLNAAIEKSQNYFANFWQKASEILEQIRSPKSVQEWNEITAKRFPGISKPYIKYNVWQPHGWHICLILQMLVNFLSPLSLLDSHRLSHSFRASGLYSVFGSSSSCYDFKWMHSVCVPAFVVCCWFIQRCASVFRHRVCCYNRRCFAACHYGGVWCWWCSPRCWQWCSLPHTIRRNSTRHLLVSRQSAAE